MKEQGRRPWARSVLNSNRTLSKNYGALGLVQSISGFHS